MRNLDQATFHEKCLLITLRKYTPLTQNVKKGKTSVENVRKRQFKDAFLWKTAQTTLVGALTKGAVEIILLSTHWNHGINRLLPAVLMRMNLEKRILCKACMSIHLPTEDRLFSQSEQEVVSTSCFSLICVLLGPESTGNFIFISRFHEF